MNEIERIVDQMERAHIGDPWTDMPFSRLLEDITHHEASAQPIPDSHSIWEIVLHLMTAQQLIVDLVHGMSRPYQPGDEWPPLDDDSAAAWAETMDRFFAGEAEVRDVVSASVAEVQLDKPLREGGTSTYNNLHGYTQHAVYHGGQISMLKKLIAEQAG